MLKYEQDMLKDKRSMFYGTQPIIFERAKELRENMTEAEQMLWSCLSKNQLGVRFKAQHPIANFIADFYCHRHKLVIEVDGGIHNSDEQKGRDGFRNEELNALEIAVLRFTNEEVKNDLENVLKTIKDKLATLKTPTP